MQTFVPSTDPEVCAEVLDMKRLGKQRVETLQLLNAIATKSGWSKHPAAKMWHNHELALIDYGITICDEWIGRGYRDTCRDKIISFIPVFSDSSIFYPDWWGAEEVHNSHRSNLLRKDPTWYGRFGWSDDPDDPYIWPQCDQPLCTRCSS